MQAALERARALGFRISSDECVRRLLAVLAAGVPAGGRVLEMGTGVGMGRLQAVYMEWCSGVVLAARRCTA